MLALKPLITAVITFGVGFVLGQMFNGTQTVSAQEDSRIFELRTYTAAEGKLGELQTRFKDHTMRLFQKNGITNIGYWIPLDSSSSQNTLVYMLAYPNREEAKKRWDAVAKDPEWLKVQAESEKQGRLVAKAEVRLMRSTDFSPLR